MKKFELLLSLSTLAYADLSFICTSTVNSELRGYGDVSLYESCGVDICACQVFELVCLERGGPELDVLTLASFDFVKSTECPTSECICNTSASWPEATYVATADGSLLPAPVFTDVPAFPDLELAANTDQLASQSARLTPETALYREIKGLNGNDSTEVINNPINEGKPNALPSIDYNRSVASPKENCSAETGAVICDLHYRLDWDLLLEASTVCSDPSATPDPCFATQACLCDNGYFRVASNMPAPPAAYLGSTNASTYELYRTFRNSKVSPTNNNSALTDDTVVKSKKDDDGLGGGAIAGIVIGSIAGLALILAVLYYGIRKHRSRSADVTPGESTTQIVPLPQSTTQVTTEMGADIALDDEEGNQKDGTDGENGATS